ncbi:MAG: ATP-binding cassette domain-containing protein [Bacteroidaceae bacterium]|nr:ATP-binding cassette domain-containing protein [Bacteroidaceae bacterium]
MIEIKDITKTFGEQRALDHVSFSVKKGEIVGLLGPNGAGKSTLMKIITCFIPPTEGELTVCGHSIFDDTLAVRRAIGYLPELNPLYPDMYVREYLRFAAGLCGVKKRNERADELVELTGLTPEAHKKIGQLSKGYRQRVGLAQALIHDPQVLILDEPTTGLDPNQLEFIRDIIRQAGKDKAVLLSTHIMQEVSAMCSRAVIINRGRIVSDDTIANLSANQLTEKFHHLTES